MRIPCIEGACFFPLPLLSIGCPLLVLDNIIVLVIFDYKVLACKKKKKQEIGGAPVETPNT